MTRRVWDPNEKQWYDPDKDPGPPEHEDPFARSQAERRRGLTFILGVLVGVAGLILGAHLLVGEGRESHGGATPTATQSSPSPAPVLAPSVETLEAAAAIQLVALKAGDVDQANELLDRFTDQWRNCEFLVQAWRASSARALGESIAGFRESVLINPPYGAPIVGVATLGGRKNGYVANAIAASCGE